ncbi:GNAT family N-acetyltransferase [Flavihumibacter fluvii]|uniref:GNAT family N-acetyltransferase n=1 Tax=Flavihumibacter fluvii TaxID=2838157 RepID=UPI001BDDF7E4|nr:GNAT family N-acetyltransferase [Flavihumibacter fluvii]ULQ51984.1 GNAT family N-acetyltransferase [Flavihumibacter fluvii]
MNTNKMAMNYTITNAAVNDLPVVYQLFEEAILFQERNNYIGWKSYDKEFIQSDIQNGLLFKIINAEDVIACIFSICYSDSLIWRDKEKGDAVYLHRIVLNRQFAGERIFKKVLEWARGFAAAKKLKYIRMDTWAENEKLIGYYKSHGFSFIENYTTADTVELPVQHRNLNVALLELPVQTNSPQAIGNLLAKVNINAEFLTINKCWTQKVIGQANGQLIKLAKGMGEIIWHKHDDQDELFILYKGHLTIQLRDKNIDLYPGELFIVPKGTEHCPVSHGVSEFLIMGLDITSNAAGGRPGNADDILLDYAANDN